MSKVEYSQQKRRTQAPCHFQSFMLFNL